MKTKHYLFATLAMTVALFAGCSNEGEENGGSDTGGAAYFTLSLVPNASGTRANTEQTGTEAECKVTNATAYFFDENYKFVEKLDYTAFGGTILNNTTTAKRIKAASQYVFVITGTQPTTTLTAGTTTFGDFNVALNTDIATAAKNNEFMMTNSGDKSNDTGVTDCLIDITNYKKTTETAAEADPAQVHVDRVVAKVEIQKAADYDFKVYPDGATADIKSWVLDRTNKTFFPYSKEIEYAGATSTAVKGIYREGTHFNDTFDADYYNVVDGNTIWKTFETGAGKDNIDYCHENTMAGIVNTGDVNYQKTNRTTAVLIKAQYTPADDRFTKLANNSGHGYTKGNSYFVYNGILYSLATLKEAATNDGSANGIKSEFEKLYTAASLTATSDDAAWNNVSPGDITTNASGISFFQKGWNYYRVLIRHDSGVEATNAMGRYGVVRNNWYVLKINSISGPADPWIPQPSDKEEEDDTDKWLSVSILVNPWTQWTQDVNL